MTPFLGHLDQGRHVAFEIAVLKTEPAEQLDGHKAASDGADSQMLLLAKRDEKRLDIARGNAPERDRVGLTKLRQRFKVTPISRQGIVRQARFGPQLAEEPLDQHAHGRVVIRGGTRPVKAHIRRTGQR